MDLPSNHYTLDDDTFRKITDLIYARSGIRFDETSKFMILRRLAARLEELQLDSFEKYYYYLRYHPNRETEIDEIFDLIATHETYFFREEAQLHAFTSEIIPQIVSERSQIQSLRIWCAGSSSGEEPYTVAILCKQHPDLNGWKVNIFASDISKKMIQASRRGVYGETSFRSTKEKIREEFFDATEDESYRIKDEIKQMVTFMKLNLLDQNGSGVLGEMDVIFCRNVIMYFDLEAKKKVIDNLYQRLRRGGYLLLGHSESLIQFDTPLKLKHLKYDMVYQK